MNAPFKKATNEIMEILPVEEPEESDDGVDDSYGESKMDNVKIVLKETDVFNIETPISPIADKEEEKEPVKVRRAVGARGGDKKPRKKRVMSDDAKEKLKVARELSLQKRRAIKAERDTLRAAEKATAVAKLAETTSFNALKNRKTAEDAADARFMKLMDTWDAGKQVKRHARQQRRRRWWSRAIQQGEQSQRKSVQSHPIIRIVNFLTIRITEALSGNLVLKL
mgnify:CR=1 FL=1